MSEWLPQQPYPSKIAFYLPSKIGGQPIEGIDRASLLQSTRNALVTLFGGATEFEATGSYTDDSNKVVSEAVTVCYSSCTDESLQSRLREVNQLANALAIEFKQDSIAVEVNNCMTAEYRRRYDRLKEEVAAGARDKWGYDKWLKVELDALPAQTANGNR